MVFFFRVGSVVLQMKIDRFRNFHGVPPVVGIIRAIYPRLSIHHDADRLEGDTDSLVRFTLMLLHFGATLGHWEGLPSLE